MIDPIHIPASEPAWRQAHPQPSRMRRGGRHGQTWFWQAGLLLVWCVGLAGARTLVPLPNPAGHALAPSLRKQIPKRATWPLVTASWYGAEYAGRPTANGEIYDPSGLTYAHRTDPFGTRKRFSVAGHSVELRCNDRGPTVPGRDVDVSEAAAKQLGMTECGVAILSVEEVGR